MARRLKLGRQPARHDPRNLMFAAYLDGVNLPTPPAALDLSTKVPTWPMFGNDQYGDCTIAAAGHMTELWTAMQGKEKSPATSTILRVYRKLSPNDQGCVEADVLKYWRTVGLSSTHKLYAYTSIDPKNHDHVRLAAALFGGVYIGFGIVNEQQTFKEFDARTPWTPQPGQPVSGHAVNVVGYDVTGVTVVTWGRTQKGTWAWWDAMVDEAYALLPGEWAKGPVPVAGFDFAALAKDINAL